MPNRRLERAAPFVFVLLWSSSFISARVGLQFVPPLWFVALRLCLSAALLVVAMLILRRSWAPLRGRWMHCAVSGVLTNTVLLDPAHVAMTRMNAAPIALIQTLNPLLTALLAWPLLREPLLPRQVIGLLLGMTGVVVIVGQAAMQSAVQVDLLLLTALGVVGMVSGTLYFGRFCRGVPLLQNATVQFLAAAAAAVAAAWLFEAPGGDWNRAAITATVWNAIGVSLGSMGLYFVMLVRGSAARATANFYLVPGTAALLAWVLLGEALSPLTLTGLAVSSIGCWMVRRRAV
jgi:drug/metabolite transporter (DMT)-like permease